MKKHVVIARLEPEGDRYLKELKIKAQAKQKRIYQNAEEWPPHVTIAAYEDMDEQALCKWVSAWAEKTERFPVVLESIKAFPPVAALETDVIYAAPASSEALKDLHTKLHSRYDEFCGTYGKRTSQKDYVFHSTLAICHKNDTADVWEEMNRQFAPFSSQIVALEVYQNPCALVARFPLKETDTAETVIRPLQKEALPKALDVIHQSFQTVAEQFGLTRENCPGHTSFLPLSFLETQMQWGWQMYALYAGKRMIGYVSLSKEGDGTYELHNLAVLPKYRHRGFGKRLLDHAKETVKAAGGKKIKLGIIEESTVLKNWYLQNGFVHTETKKFDHLPFTSGYLKWENEQTKEKNELQ